ncbi:hypothetical protein TruAng_010267 [Truncatella angustata]|nr:hypothetical protein TruAng_010267 [Truncatella angustata]
MPVQTRAAGQPQASKVYRAEVSEPKQQHFPSRRRHIKTYGRRTAPKRMDQTLTQMNFVSSAAQEELQLLSDDEDGLGAADPSPVASKKRAKKKSGRSTRRRTMGDVDDDQEHEKPRDSKRRRTMGDAPSAPSSFHTQTLTQFLSSTSKDDDDWDIPDLDGEDDLGIIKETPKKKKQKEGASGHQAFLSAAARSVTPSNRMTKLEIPSSQSPATPLLLRYSPAKEPSPLKNKSANIAASQSVLKGTSKMPRDKVIQDSCSTTHSSPVTPTPKAKVRMMPIGTVTPVKKLRFELPEDKENITPGRTKPKSPKPASQKSSKRQPLSEVPDSDGEFDDTENEEDDIGVSVADTPERFTRSRSSADEIIIATDADVDVDEVEDEGHVQYSVGVETQVLLVSSGDRSSLELGTTKSPRTPPIEDTKRQEGAVGRYGSTSNTHITVQAEDEIIEHIPTEKLDNRSDEIAAKEHQDYTQALTQGIESQRVPLETIKATGPITDKSDIIISIYGQHVENMVARTKTHEFRDWKFPASVHRVWIYITRPKSELRYMCIFGPPKTAGEIGGDGIGNADFNKGMKRSKFAYEVLHMYELNNPVSLKLLKQNGWPAAPQKFSYVPPAVVGQLTSNLRCALWDGDTDQDIIHSSPDVTESQELADQIRSDMSHATEIGGPPDHAEVIPSSQSPPRTIRKRSTPRGGSAFARPALPETLSASSSRSLPRSHSQKGRGDLRASQATTISQVSTSSPMVSPEKSVPLPSMIGARRAAPLRLPETSSPTAYRQSHHSLRSSQFPTKSQMLPDSLLNGDIQEPPPIIWDSADDESD